MPKSKRSKKPPKTVEVLFVTDDEGYWLASFPQFPGLHTFGETLKEVKKKAKGAFNAWIDQHKKLGIPVRIRD